jgi:hypothetical protein
MFISQREKNQIRRNIQRNSRSSSKNARKIRDLKKSVSAIEENQEEMQSKMAYNQLVDTLFDISDEFEISLDEVIKEFLLDVGIELKAEEIKDKIEDNILSRFEVDMLDFQVTGFQIEEDELYGGKAYLATFKINDHEFKVSGKSPSRPVTGHNVEAQKEIMKDIIDNMSDLIAEELMLELEDQKELSKFITTIG